MVVFRLLHSLIILSFQEACLNDWYIRWLGDTEQHSSDLKAIKFNENKQSRRNENTMAEKKLHLTEL